jgi:hypothetical protein
MNLIFLADFTVHNTMLPLISHPAKILPSKSEVNPTIELWICFSFISLTNVIVFPFKGISNIRIVPEVVP